MAIATNGAANGPANATASGGANGNGNGGDRAGAGNGSGRGTGKGTDAQQAYELPLSGQLGMMLSAFWSSPVRARVLVLTVALLVVIVATTYATYRLNEWNGPFYDALSRRDMPEFLHQLVVFAVIAFALTLLNVIQAWLNQITAMRMREGLARDLANVWLTPGRALKLGGAGAIADNPDQRLHEDTRILAENTTALAIGLVNSTILLVSFIGVLWSISTGFALTLFGSTFVIPGYMLWATILYAVIGSVLSNLVGSRLARLNADRYAREADLRAALVRANENIKPITLARGEASELVRVQDAIGGVLEMLRKLAWALTNLTWVSSGFGWLALVAPIIIASPMYFSGQLTFGGLMMAVGAFNQVNQALRWYVANFSVIADWRATLARVSFFRNALLSMDTPSKEGAVITYKESEPEEGISIAGLSVYGEPDKGEAGHGIRVAEGTCAIRPGDRVMINGDPGSDRHLFFQALAGIWPWGSGEISRPASDRIIMMPQEGYLPVATLREVMTYPANGAGSGTGDADGPAGVGDARGVGVGVGGGGRDPVGDGVGGVPETGAAQLATVSDEELAAALEKVGLNRLVSRLGDVERWDRLLDKDEEVALQIANAVLRKPDWLVMDEVFEGLEPETRERLLSVVASLEHSTLIYIGRSEEFAKTFSPKLYHLSPLQGKAAGEPSPDTTSDDIDTTSGNKA